MLGLRRVRAAGVFLLVTACGGESEPDCLAGCGPGAGVGGSGAGAGAGGGGGTLASPVPAPEGPFPGAGEAAAACDEPGTVVDVFDAKSIRAWLVRRWYFCSGSYIFLDTHAGIEIVDDGTWYFLDLVDGQLVRREGFSGGGNWSFHENQSSTPNAYSVQVNFDRFSGGGIGGFVRFAVSPLKVNLSMGGAGPSEYVAVGP